MLTMTNVTETAVRISRNSSEEALHASSMTDLTIDFYGTAMLLGTLLTDSPSLDLWVRPTMNAACKGTWRPLSTIHHWKQHWPVSSPDTGASWILPSLQPWTAPGLTSLPGFNGLCPCPGPPAERKCWQGCHMGLVQILEALLHIKIWDQMSEYQSDKRHLVRGDNFQY